MRQRFQFSLRTMFLVTTLVAIYFSIACSLGYIEASGMLVAAVLLALAVLWKRKRWFVVLRFAIGVLGLAVLWFVVVDWSWFVESCEHCHLSRDVLQYRVLRRPVYETRRDFNAEICRVAEDLGAACPHRIQRFHKYRCWGLVYPANPCFPGTIRLTGEDWYEDQMAETVRAKARTSPALGREFRERVIFAQDFGYWRKFVNEIRQSRQNGTGPPQGPATGGQFR